MKTIWFLGDQLSLEHEALKTCGPNESAIFLIEAKARGSRLRYHRLKLVLIYSAMRHFARDLRARGWQVDYQLIDETPSFEAGLQRHVERFAPNELVAAAPNSFAETEALGKAGAKGARAAPVRCAADLFASARNLPRVGARGRDRLLMENHYRSMGMRFGS